jgi:hypothetical protein
MAGTCGEDPANTMVACHMPSLPSISMPFLAAPDLASIDINIKPSAVFTAERTLSSMMQSTAKASANGRKPASAPPIPMKLSELSREWERPGLSPAYDFVSTIAYLDDFTMALSVLSKNGVVFGRLWLRRTRMRLSIPRGHTL